MPVFDKDTARIKMVALTKGDLKNIRWYSLSKYDKPGTQISDQAIINGMLRRIKAKPEITLVHKIQFFDNKTDELILEVNG